MDVQATITQVKQACNDLVSAYETLRTNASPAADELDGAIGRVRQWKVTRMVDPSEPRLGTEVVYQDNKPRSFGLLGVVSTEEVPHPDAEDARTKAKELFDDAAENDENYDLDSANFKETVDAVCNMMTTWLDIASTFSTKVVKVIPSNTVYIPTTGGMQGWLSPTASDAYQASASSQDSAADTTSDIISSLLENCADFLNDIQTNLVNLAGLTVAQDDFYLSLIDGLPTDISMSTILDTISTGVSTVNEHKKLQNEECDAMTTMLNDSLEDTLKLADLDRDITEMGEQPTDKGWPQPAAIAVGTTEEGSPSTADLEFNTQYFKDHSQFWRNVSAEFGPLKTSADAITDIPVMFLRLPQFSADQSAGLNALSDRLATDVLGEGATATAAMADKLDATIQDYLKQEAENEAAANEIYKAIYGEDLP